jgi:hypothetical protein
MPGGTIDIRRAAENAQLAGALFSTALEAREDMTAARRAALSAIREQIGRTSASDRVEYKSAAHWQVVSLALVVIEAILKLNDVVAAGSAGVIEAKARLDLLLTQLETVALPVSAMENIAALVHASKRASESLDIRPVLEQITMLPLPNLYWHERIDEVSPFAPPSQMNGEHDTFPRVLKVVAFLDRAPLLSPQVVLPQTLYDLSVRVVGAEWPEQYTSLLLRFITTAQKDQFSASPLQVNRPSDTEAFDVTLSGQISFPMAQSVLAMPLSFAINGTFEGEGIEPRGVAIVGHNHLNFRVRGDSSFPYLTGQRHVDAHVEDLLNRLVAKYPAVRAELDGLVPLLRALTLAHLHFAKSAVFKDASRVRESEFQRELLSVLRIALGPDVEEHTNQAGGITDIKYRGVIAELKVESSNGDRQAIAASYSGQTTQYQGVEGRQVGVAVILDVTEKVAPPGDVRNDILLCEVATHGNATGSSAYPSFVFVFVINGNTRSPSSYSR